jgi:SAM-dependent methyltransferase
MSHYDTIAQKYRESIIQEPYMIYSCDPTVLNLLGTLTDKTILDYGCGEGYFIRLLKRLGAKQITGFDQSNEMIRLAQQSENTDPLGITYLVADGKNLPNIGRFDIVMARFVLHYAKTKPELQLMVQNAYNKLADTGTFIALIPQFTDSAPANPKYGYTYQAPTPLQDGDTVTVTLYPENGACFSFTNQYWHTTTYATALKTAGFNNIVWHPMTVSEEGLRQYGKAFWDDYLTSQSIVAVTATKTAF